MGELDHASRRMQPRRPVAAIVLSAAALAAACSNAKDDTAAVDASADTASPGCLFSCGDAAPPAWTDPALPLAARMTDLLHGCTGAEPCHANGTGGLTIAFGDEFAGLVRVPSNERPELVRVLPSDPSRSYLYLKLAGDGGIEGGTMPQGLPYDVRRPQLAWQWIEAGAPAK